MDRYDIAYENMTLEDVSMILDNRHCAEPCLLDSTNMATCNLNPGPFKRIACILLVQAWNLDKVDKNAEKEPMQPKNSKITYDANLVGDIYPRGPHIAWQGSSVHPNRKPHLRRL